MKPVLKNEMRNLLLIDDEPEIIEMVFAMLKRYMMRYLSIYLSQQEVERARRVAMKSF